MGRTGDARKRSRGRRGEEGPEPPVAPAPPAPAEETLIFPSEGHDPDDPMDQRLTLPASGLAEEILAMTDAGALRKTASGPAGGGHDPADPEPSSALTPGWGHNISFFAPTRDERKAAEATEHLATFFLADEEYGVDVRSVQEIIRVGEVTQVPRAPAHIKGVINLRGRIIPVVDLRTKLGLGQVAGGRQARIVVVKLRDRLIGLLVDGASQVLKVPLSTIEAAPDEVADVDAQTIRGVAKMQDRLIILLDLLKVLAHELKEVGPGS